jgi:hypothetical protein
MLRHAAAQVRIRFHTALGNRPTQAPPSTALQLRQWVPVAKSEMPGITPPGGRPVCGTAATTCWVLSGPAAGSTAPRAQDRVAFVSASSPHWGCEPCSGVAPPTRELRGDVTVPHARNNPVSVVVEGPRAARDRERPTSLLRAIEATGGAGDMPRPHP